MCQTLLKNPHQCSTNRRRRRRRKEDAKGAFERINEKEGDRRQADERVDGDDSCGGGEDLLYLILYSRVSASFAAT